LAAQKAAGRYANLALCPTHGGLTRPTGDFANSIRCYSDPDCSAFSVSWFYERMARIASMMMPPRLMSCDMQLLAETIA
jgi:hypothetical protein